MPLAGRDGLGHGRCAGRFRHVDANGEGGTELVLNDLLRLRRRTGLVDVRDGDAGALGSQPLRDGRADPARRAP